MSTFLVPDDPRRYPTLGPAIVDLMEAGLVFGPGDLRKRPYVVDDEARGIVYSCYEVFPRNHPMAGQRLYDTAVYMARKGSRKSELAGALIAVELHPDGPVRTDGWYRNEPIGRPVTDPYIPVVAYSEEQAEDTSWKAVYVMLSEGPHADLFDIAQDRIKRKDGTGEATALATAPDSRDGARTTFQVKEEIHRWDMPRQLEAHATMSANLGKRPLAEPWEFMPTTAYKPGAGSLGEIMHDAAKVLATRSLAEQRAARFWFFYRWADERIRITNPDGSTDHEALARAIVDASGPVLSEWSRPDRIAARWTAPAADPDYSERVWLNRVKVTGDTAFDMSRWKVNIRLDEEKQPWVCPRTTLIVAGFDGSRVDDHTGIVGTDIATGFQWRIGWWDPADYGGEIPEELVDVAVDEMMSTWRVHWMYCDPPYWKDAQARWRGKYGDKVVLPWETYRNRQMGEACRDYAVAIAAGHITHPGDPVFTSHIGNCRKRLLTDVRDDRGERLWTVQKERPHSPHKIDLGAAGIISWRARTDAIAAGAGRSVRRSVYEDADMIVL